jgi:hypothetical protein
MAAWAYPPASAVRSYYVRRCAKPPRRCALALAVKVGSVYEVGAVGEVGAPR